MLFIFYKRFIISLPFIFLQRATYAEKFCIFLFLKEGKQACGIM
uniref:Uncharacterized protein n=1 Tax=Anguilla anguilla TaxID=7936 RepID=A0A0E9W7X4_ANGAN